MSESKQTPSIGLLGVGAIGTLMAWHWRSHSVVTLNRNPASPGCQRQLTLLTGDSVHLTLPAWHGTALDWLVVTTKAPQTLSALLPWKEHLTSVRRILLLQNGMGQQQELDTWLKDHRITCEVWLGISTEGAFRTSSTHIIYAGAGDTVIGPSSAHASRPHIVPAGLTAVEDIQRRQREKLAINAVINPLTGLLKCKNGELVSNPDYRSKLMALSEEVQSFYQHCGWELSEDLVNRTLSIAEATGANTSSTLQDILAGRPTELDYIGGYLLNIAKRTNYPMPLTQKLHETVRTDIPQ